MEQTVTGLPGANVNGTEQISFANEPAPVPGELGLFLRPFAGNQGTYAGQALPINVILSQIVSATPNRTYTLTGHSYMATGYSGSTEFLDPLSPANPAGDPNMPSPTETYFEMAFLDAANNVVGTPTKIDLRTEPTRDAWATHTMMAVAPANASKLKFTAAGLDMVENFGFQDVYFDNFVLKRDGDGAAINRLVNGDLNMVGEPNGWTVNEQPPGTDTIGFRDFANHTMPGEQGLWLRAFEAGDGTLSQTVAAIPGGNYTFSAWSKWEAGYSGDNETWPGTTTETKVEMAFLDGADNVIGTPISLDLDAAGQNNDGEWRQYSVNGIAPTGTAKVRVSAAGLDMQNLAGSGQMSAFFDDFVLQLAGAPGDYSGDGVVDGRDFLVWQRGGSPSPLSTADLNTWKAAFPGGPAVPSVAGVPEPAALGLALCGLLAVGLRRRQMA
ncbi:MAG: hypothetical protein DCC67_21125 [Planctomycetota bacterium]|nr:MAG: hypothetical protein DCC67_21125 [Planctomycetota bacterium]